MRQRRQNLLPAFSHPPSAPGRPIHLPRLNTKQTRACVRRTAWNAQVGSPLQAQRPRDPWGVFIYFFQPMYFFSRVGCTRPRTVSRSRVVLPGAKFLSWKILLGFATSQVP